MEKKKGKNSRTPTLYVATFNIDGGENEELRGVNKAKLLDLVRRTVKDRAGEGGNGYFEVRKVYTEEERRKLSIPDGINGMVDQRTSLVNGYWKTETPFKEYF